MPSPNCWPAPGRATPARQGRSGGGDYRRLRGLREIGPQPTGYPECGVCMLWAMEALSARAVVLVEGVSDQRALEALAERRGRNLAAEGVSVVPIGGAQGIGNFLERFGPRGLNVRLAGLCDAAEEEHFRRGLER